jgi:hypothetical protein
MDLNLDKKSLIPVGGCSCCISLSTRDIIDVAVVPAMLDLTTVISASIVNIDMFSHYKIPHLFILGNFVKPSCVDSSMNKLLSILLQNALEDSNIINEIEPKCYFAPESADMPLTQASEECTRSFLYRSFRRGIFNQVSREGYGLVFSYANDYISDVRHAVEVSYMEGKRFEKLATLNADSAFIILQKGQLISTKEFTTTFYMTITKDVIKNMGEFNHTRVG